MTARNTPNPILRPKSEDDRNNISNVLDSAIYTLTPNNGDPEIEIDARRPGKIIKDGVAVVEEGWESSVLPGRRGILVQILTWSDVQPWGWWVYILVMYSDGTYDLYSYFSPKEENGGIEGPITLLGSGTWTKSP